MSEALATSLNETPVFFPSGDETLFGVLTTPSNPRGVGVVFLYGGGHNVSAHVGGIWTRAARDAARLGFHAFRFDHRGNGDSTGRTDTFDHRHPYSDDLAAAIDWMRGVGLDRFIIVGDCLGARAGLVVGQDMDGLEGLYLMSAMVYDSRMGRAEEWAQQYGLTHYLRRAFQWKTIKRLADPQLRRSYLRVGTAKVRRVLGKAQQVVLATHDHQGQLSAVSSNFLDPLAAVLARGIRVNFVFGTLDTERKGDFDMAGSGRLGRILENAGSLVEVSSVEGRIVAHMDMSAQDSFVESLGEWLQSF